MSMLPAYQTPQILSTIKSNKCAYCETRDARSHGTVEHVRPKSGWQQVRGPKVEKPGYFWLAYEWTNLLFSCSMCNDQGHKGNFFPLEDAAVRATANARDLRAERPLLLDPYGPIDPEDHIKWDDYVPKPRGNSLQGHTSIETFGLDRDLLLVDERRSLLESTTGAVAVAEQQAPGSPERMAMRGVLLGMLDGSEEYTAMLRANLGERIRAL